MANAVLKVPRDVIQKMREEYATFMVEKIPQGGLFVAKLPTCTVTAYKSGKVLFQGAGADKESMKWGEKQSQSSKPVSMKSNKKEHSFTPPVNISSLSILGSDEVGTGDYFGPMTVVAAYVSKDHLALLKELGVKDSKNLNDIQICSIAKEIIEVIPYSLLVLHNEKYNDLQAKGMTQGKMKTLLHNQALQHVLDKITPQKPDGILIDQFAEPETYFRHLAGQKRVVRENVYFSTKAEGVHLAVAAASIISRYAFVKEFEKLSKKVGVDLPKGAGAKVDQVAADIIKEQGIDVLKKITKYHFANTDKAKKIAKYTS
ncbi:ribonuclease HIII [Bacillus timonensis]|nr:ribonuclease HIII [Bacillus timonensis]